MALELWSWHRAVMALVWPWVYSLGLEGSGLGLNGRGLEGPGLGILALTTSLYNRENLSANTPRI
jgi:hypothetical protein